MLTLELNQLNCTLTHTHTCTQEMFQTECFSLFYSCTFDARRAVMIRTKFVQWSFVHWSIRRLRFSMHPQLREWKMIVRLPSMTFVGHILCLSISLSFQVNSTEEVSIFFALVVVVVVLKCTGHLLHSNMHEYLSRDHWWNGWCLHPHRRENVWKLIVRYLFNCCCRCALWVNPNDF